jgi:predicted anti-sigma-YlaC factor YlaD
MKACRKIRPLLEWLAANELDDSRRQLAEAHLRACPACRRELNDWRSLLAAAAVPAAAAEAEIRAIDWDAVSGKILAGVEGQSVPRRRPPAIFQFPFLAAAAVLIAVIGLGVFFWIHPSSAPLPARRDDRLSAAAMARLQSGLARQEAVSYLQQSQLMLTDLLTDCANEEIAPWEIRLYSRQAKQLLLKKKYFQPYLSETAWAKVRSVSERIDWLNYEILQLDERQLCGQIGRLQKIMEDERLLLKIRLAEKDLAFRPYQEV